jgi:hypothetical protein
LENQLRAITLQEVDNKANLAMSCFVTMVKHGLGLISLFFQGQKFKKNIPLVQYFCDMMCGFNNDN